MSHSVPISARRIRSASLKRLLTLLRTTAFPKALETVNPNLGPAPSCRSIRRQKAAKYGPAIRVPWSYALRKSEVLRIRALFGKPNLVGVPDGSLVADRKLVAAFRAPSCEYRASILGAHANPESVCFGPFAVIGLKCTFRHLISSARASHPKRRSKLQYTTKRLLRSSFGPLIG